MTNDQKEEDCMLLDNFLFAFTILDEIVTYLQIYNTTF